jgi:hypothetical protein
MMIGKAMTISMGHMSRLSTEPDRPAGRLSYTDDQRNRDHAEAGRRWRDAPAVQHATEEVAPERISAEPVRRRRRLQAIDHALGGPASARSGAKAATSSQHHYSADDHERIAAQSAT